LLLGETGDRSESEKVREKVVQEDLFRIAVHGREWAQRCARQDDALIYVYLLALETESGSLAPGRDGGPERVRKSTREGGTVR
jgi:hypothetical protein